MEDLSNLVTQKIEQGENLIKSLSVYSTLEGIQKLERKIKQEINFLKKVSRSHKIKIEHLQCTNLTHFGALVSVLNNTSNRIAVNKPFAIDDDRKLLVDIVCDSGCTWMKVIARNPKSLSQICLGETNYGVKSIVDQAEEYLDCAEMYPCLFQTPKIMFYFYNGIGVGLAQQLESMGIQVLGNRISDLDVDAIINSNNAMNSLSNPICSNNEDVNATQREEGYITHNTGHNAIETKIFDIDLIPRVNVDVSAMLAYVSSVTNGSCKKYRFEIPVLAQQAAWEMERPVKPLLDIFFKGKQLFCCQTAADSFRSILHTVGGENERIRGEQLLQRITVLPDDATFFDVPGNSGDSNANAIENVFSCVQYNAETEVAESKLAVGGKIRERSLLIFKFGDRIKSVTVSSNDGFVRAAKQNGINFVAFIHESRALSEQKELSKATPIL